MSMLGRPPRAALVNLADNTRLDFLVNPSQVREAISAEYERIAPLGLSHQVLQYKGTTNLKLPLELYHSKRLNQRLSDNVQAMTIGEMRAWLMSLLFPVASQEYVRKSPPEVLFVWPNVWRLRARVIDVTTQHEEFDNETLGMVRFVATVSLESVLSRRKLMEDIKSEGTIWVQEGA